MMTLSPLYLETASKSDQVLCLPRRPVPDDVWHNIFKCCLPHMEERRPYMQVRAPWTLSQVCRHWRRLLHSSPSLWSHITIFAIFEPDGYETSDRIISRQDLLKRQLELSQKCPLDIMVSYHRNNFNWTSPYALWVQLIPHLTRARSLFVLDWYSDQLYLSARAALPTSTVFPFLDYLYWNRHNKLDGYNLPLFDLFRNAPKLRSLSLCGEIGGAVSHIPWNFPTTVHLSETNISGIISQLSNARELELKKVTVQPTEHQQRIALSRLRSMDVGANDLLALASVDYSSPNIQSFLVTHPYSEESQIGTLSTLLHNTDACNTIVKITALVPIVHDSPSDISLLEKLLKSLPALSVLNMRIPEMRMIHDVMEILLSCGAHNLCPALRSIRFDAPFVPGGRLLQPMDIPAWISAIRRRGLGRVEIGAWYRLGSDYHDRWQVIDDDLAREGYTLQFAPGYTSRKTPRILTSLTHRCSLSAISEIARNGDISALYITHRSAL